MVRGSGLEENVRFRMDQSSFFLDFSQGLEVCSSFLKGLFDVRLSSELDFCQKNNVRSSVFPSSASLKFIIIFGFDPQH